MIKPRTIDLHAEINAFNATVNVGDEVVVVDDTGEKHLDRVFYPATLLGGHTPVAWLAARGCYRLDRVSAKRDAIDVAAPACGDTCQARD